MTETLTLDFVTPEAMMSSEEVEMVVVPGKEGDFGVLAQHTPFVSSLRPGVVRVYEGDTVKDRILVTGGFAEVTNERCTILADEAYDFKSTNKQELEKRLEAIRQIHQRAEDEHEKLEAQSAVEIAEAVIDAFISEADA